eukprot:SAG25_NODE_124_length_14606_cov_739.419177_13_plen_247_part_00
MASRGAADRSSTGRLRASARGSSVPRVTTQEEKAAQQARPPERPPAAHDTRSGRQSWSHQGGERQHGNYLEHNNNNDNNNNNRAGLVSINQVGVVTETQDTGSSTGEDVVAVQPQLQALEPQPQLGVERRLAHQMELESEAESESKLLEPELEAEPDSEPEPEPQPELEPVAELKPEPEPEPEPEPAPRMQEGEKGLEQEEEEEEEEDWVDISGDGGVQKRVTRAGVSAVCCPSSDVTAAIRFVGR